MSVEIYEDVYCAKCGQQAAIKNKLTGHVIAGAYFEGSDGCSYCKPCFGVGKPIQAIEKKEILVNSVEKKLRAIKW